MTQPPRPSQRPGPTSRQTGADGVALSEDDARRIVEEGDAERLVTMAAELGPRLGVNLTQLRRFFGEVKRIEMLWSQPGAEDRARRRAILLEPRLSYQVQRQTQVRALRNVLQPCLKFAAKDRDRFQRFVEFYEALIAYAPRTTQGGRE
jgi:CRISPR type III-A-associated protein Csm2